MTIYSHIFYPKKSKNHSKGPVPIYLRITVNGKRAEVSIKKMVDFSKWNNKGSRMKGSNEEAKKFNAYLSTLASKLNAAYLEMIAEEIPITAENLKNRFSGVQENNHSLLTIVGYHNDEIKAMIGNGYTTGTLLKYNTTKNHLADFIKWKYRTCDIPLSQLKYQFMADFEFYLKSEAKIGQNTTSKYIKNTKKIIKECFQKGWVKTNPFEFYKTKTFTTNPTFLFDYELKAIQDKVFKIDRLAKIRDLFLFSCYTGLAFIDVFNLTANNISIGIDGNKWIFTNRQKNDEFSPIPLLPQALEILNRYKDDPEVINRGKLLPIPTHQKVNEYLKEIATACEINKNLTFHVARHTFATTVTLSNGVPIESVQKMLGHAKIQTTQHYARVLDQKLSNDMQTLRSKLSSPIKETSNQSELAG